MVKGVISHYHPVLEVIIALRLERNTFSVRLSGRTFLLQEKRRQNDHQ